MFLDNSSYSLNATCARECLIFKLLIHRLKILFWFLNNYCLGSEMVSMLPLSVEDHRFNPRPGQTKDIKLDIYCFLAKHATFRNNKKESE